MMFTMITIGMHSYVEPKPVLASIIDDNGQQITIGDERDLREFNEIFLSRISDALSLSQTGDEIAELFNGKKIQVKAYVDPMLLTKVEQTSSDKFFNILINLQAESDLYEAWEKDHQTTIDNYEAVEGQPRVKLTMTEYLDSLPTSLVFQMNRTFHNRETQLLEKSLHKVKIPLLLNP